MNWHYVDQGQQTGPVSEEQFAAFLAAGKITAATLVWCDGMENWQPYGSTPAGQKTFPAPRDTAIAPAGTMHAEAVCAECGKIFPLSETIPHGGVRVCAGCKPVFMQKLAEGARLNTGGLNYASVLTRFGAAFLDGLILGAVNFGIGIVGGLSISQAVGAEPRTGMVMLQVVLFAVQLGISLGYETFMIGKYGATLGKMACKIKVVSPEGGPISYGRACGRYFAKQLSGIMCLIGYIIACFDKPENRALHDRLCNTRVVMK